MIVTLAGHVDHGKTSLVRALSGVDTDRLEQEKQRGLTIDLGFAYIDEGNIGFVDVPGHSKFIHNMVAGVASQQHALLVIAADDGPMPQSKEHLEILSLVGINSGVIALTKCDRVSPERIQACQVEIAALVSGSFLADAQIVPTSIEDPASIDTLLAHLRSTAEHFESKTSQEPFRLAIDRTFVVRGAGLVVTGTVHSGSVRVDDSLFHFPSQTQVRVRSIRAQDQAVEQAQQGDRCALNITGVDLADVRRGDWLTAEITPKTIEITVNASVLNDFPRPVKHWTPIHIYHATSHSTGRIALLTDTRLAPGQTSMVDLICDEPLAVRHGDQLILRDQSLDVTLGGATVLHANTTPTLRRRAPSRISELAHYAQTTPTSCLAGLLSEGVTDVERFRQIWNLTAEQTEQLVEQQDALRIDHFAFSKALWAKLQAEILQAVESHQRAHPSSPGLKENNFTSVKSELRQALLSSLLQSNKLANEAGLYRLPEHKAELPDALDKVWQRLEPELDKKQAPSTGDIAKLWRVAQPQLESDLKELTKRGLVTHIANHRFYLPRQLEALAEDVKVLAGQKPFSVREFRDATSIGRNVAIEVLEYFDRRGFTRRQDNERIVLKDKL